MGILYPTADKNNEWHGATLVLTSSRTSGIGPLAVDFDLLSSTFAQAEGLMLAEFMWDFGDSGDPYNIGKGYVTSHVYRDPGTYNVTCTAYLYGQIKDTVQTTVTVESVESQVDWTTYYVSLSGSDSNDGLSESTPFLTPKYAIETFVAENTRFLLRQGDTFTQSGDSIQLGDSESGPQGPVIISSYEDAGSPSSVKPVIYFPTNDGSHTTCFSLRNCNDIRFVNVKVQATGGPQGSRDTNLTYPSGFVQSGVDPSSYCLFLDCDAQGCGSLSFSIQGDYNVMQGCTVRDGGSYGVFSAASNHCAYIGLSMKEFGDQDPEYTMRISGTQKYHYIAYNDLWGDYTKTTFTLRGDDTSYNYVWNNQFDRAAGINPTNDEEDQILHHNTFDSNICVVRDYEGHNVQGYDQNAFYVCSNTTMIRNNIAYGFEIGVTLGEHAINGGCTTVWLYNNTVITSKDYSKLFSVRQSCSDMYMYNNIFYDSNSTSGIDGDRMISFGNVGKFPIQPDLDVFDADYNIYRGEQWGDVSTKQIINVTSGDNATLAQWQSLWGHGFNSLYDIALINITMDTDDVLTSLANGFATLQNLSPAKGSADPNTRYTLFDFNGDKRVSYDMGAISTEVE